MNLLALVVTGYVALHYLLQAVMLVVAWVEIRRQKRRRYPWEPRQVEGSAELPAISVIVPAHNEEISIERTVRSLLAQGYSRFEVVVVNDGSRDGTLAELREAFDLRGHRDFGHEELPTQPVLQILTSAIEPRLLVVDKRNGGKADALNAGINHARHELVCCIDADVVLDRWALYHLALPFVADPDTIASSGMIRLSNGCRIEDARVVEARLPKRWLELLQVLEYVRAYAIGRMFFNFASAHLIISGAFGLFRRRNLVEVGGYQPAAIGEDIELVVRLHERQRKDGKRYRIQFVADAVCYTEGPHSVPELGRQRTRWHLGLLSTLRIHSDLLLRPRYGVVGLLAMPYFTFFELLAPIIEAVGWGVLPLALVFGRLEPGLMALFLGAAMLFGTAVSMAAVAIDALENEFRPRARDQARLALGAVVEHFGYHQMTVWFRLRAFWRYYRTIQVHGGWRSPLRRRKTEPESAAEA